MNLYTEALNSLRKREGLINQLGN